jgi:lipid-A-disaccharide synthase
MHPDKALLKNRRVTETDNAKRIMIVAGEASGDLHGGNLVCAMHQIDPSLRFYGIGGNILKAAGVELIADSADMAVVGLTEVVSKLGMILKVMAQMKASLKADRPDLIILIDYPDFNLSLAKAAKKYGVRVFYYISPQVWAWRSGRINTLRRLVDKILVILPFEEALYKTAGVDAHFVGHPLLDQVKPILSREEVRSQLGVSEGKNLIALLPGSRQGEVRRHLPLMMKAASILNREVPGLSFVISQAESIEDGVMTTFLSTGGRWKVWKGRPYDLIHAVDFLIVASGTVTLEAGLLGTPMVIIYSLSWLSWTLGRMLVRGVKHVGLINLVLGKGVVPELLQNEASPEKIAQVARGLLEDEAKRMAMRKELLSVRSKLGEAGASRRAALQIARFVESS